MPFLFFLEFFMAFVEVQGSSCSNCFFSSMGNFLLRVVSGILSAMLFKIVSHIFMIFEVKLE